MGNEKRRQVRVIAGQLKGRRLSYPDDRGLRPTMDRTREALFSSIHGRIGGCVFVDLFCAAGGVGIEAVSRGARVAHFVEKDPAALRFLQRNIETCGIGEDRYQIYAEDVLQYLERGALDGAGDAVVFADPPYGGDVTARLLAHFSELAGENVVLFVLEHRHAIDAPRLGSLVFARSKRFGDTHLSYWERQD